MKHTGTGENGLAVILDSTTKGCEDSGEVLGVWGHGFRYLGKAEWNRTLRIALRPQGSAPISTDEARAMKPEIDALLRERGIRAVVLLQSPSQGGVTMQHRAWNLYGRSGNPYKWAGTTWLDGGIWRCPVLHPHNYEFAYGWLIRRWFLQALGLARGTVRPLPWPTLHTAPTEASLQALSEIARDDGPISVDIETSKDKTVITAIAFATEHYAVSLPWDCYQVAGKGYMEPGLESYLLGTRARDLALGILASKTAKVGHNYTFDIYQLRQRGYEHNGEVEDTLLMAHTVFNQYRKGLQQAAAIEYCVEPWKSQYKKNRVPDGQDEWLADPQGLRTYNAQDAWVTRKIYDSLLRKLG